MARTCLILVSLLALASCSRGTGLFSSGDSLADFTNAVHQAVTDQKTYDPAYPGRALPVRSSLDVNDELDQLKNYLDKSNLYGAQGILRNIMMQFPDSQGVQDTGEIVLGVIRDKKKAELTAVLSQANSALKQAADVLPKAEKPEDLDDLLKELADLPRSLQRVNGYDPGSTGQLVEQCHTCERYLILWQNFLLARETGNARGMQIYDQHLLLINKTGLSLPRSQLIERLSALESTAAPAQPAAPLPATNSAPAQTGNK